MNHNRLARVVMVQGTSSHAGKSLLATALCRIFQQDGFRTAPFKAQNMSLNSCPTPDGLEIGRSQATQAAAAGIPARVEMNPVLLKPETEGRTQVVVMGRPVSAAATEANQPRGPQLWDVVVKALDRLRREFDIVVIEGAGSPVELNIKERDIVNMRVARHADAPVLLVGDIDLGGVFAQMVGTLALLEPAEHRLVKGLVVNKLRGDPGQFASGVDILEERTGVPVAGVLPFLPDVQIPEEDGVGLPTTNLGDAGAVLDVAVMRLPHIANFDDFDPLGREPGVQVRFVGSAADFGEPDLLILPGSKTTMADLDWLRVQGLAERIRTARSSGTSVIGICAGFQMLGTHLLDPDRVESRVGEAAGLGLVSTTTTFQADKTRHQVTAVVEAGHGLLAGCSGMRISGYESHKGDTTGDMEACPISVRTRSGRAVRVLEGRLDEAGLTLGTYLHGLFHNHDLRRRLLDNLARRKGVTLPDGLPEFDPDYEYDRLAVHVRRHLDMDLVYRMMENRRPAPGPAHADRAEF